MPDPELREDAGEVTLYRAAGKEEGRRHLAVRLALCDEGCHTFLRRCQRAGRRRPAADPLAARSSRAPPRARRRYLRRLASASSSVARASLRRFARRCAAPSASSVRPRSSGSSTFACHASASAYAASAPSRSPVCAASSPRQRRLAARAEARSSRRAFPSYQPRSFTASSRRPSSINAST